MADIMPPPTPAERDPWPLVDGCPNCVANVEPPLTAQETSAGWSCAYTCSDCGHAWTTDWSR